MNANPKNLAMLDKISHRRKLNQAATKPFGYPCCPVFQIIRNSFKMKFVLINDIKTFNMTFELSRAKTSKEYKLVGQFPVENQEDMLVERLSICTACLTNDDLPPTFLFF